MIRAQIEVEPGTFVGIDTFNVNLINGLKDAVKSSSKNIEKKAKSLAPVGKTKNLKKSIKAKIFNNGLSSTVAPRKPRGAHRHIVAYGTGGRRARNGANRGVMPSNPFMQRAEKSEDAAYTQKIRSVINAHAIV